MENLCGYGCGQEAHYQMKNGKWCCSKSWNSCPENKKKNSCALKKAYKEGRKVSTKEWYSGLPDEIKEKMKWNKGLTKETDKRVRKNGQALSDNIKSGKTKPSFKGRKHTKETRQKQSDRANENNNGYVKTKYYEILCPKINEIVKVQGTWELKFATYLNENHINWIRSRKINFRYRLDEEDYMHTYFPDFYLPDSDEYVEIKGHWWKNEDGRVDDKRKMEQVLKYNPTKNIRILLKEDLIKLGIFVK